MYVIIPARYESTRLPGKALADVCGKSLIQRVYECAAQSGSERIIIATDDERIQSACKKFGAEVCMTAATHQSGTDRIAEVIATLGITDDEIVVNLQGDEPLMPPELIQQVAQALQTKSLASVSTACYPISERASLENPNVVKLVMDQDGYALYFSRAAIPWPRDIMQGQAASAAIKAYHHIGLYAYRAGFVTRYAAWSACELEQAERLEQLRVLWHGEKIAVVVSDTKPGVGVDTPDDLKAIQQYFSADTQV